jgi:hypothetical protein
MLKTWSQRKTSGKVAFQLVAVLGLVAVGCGGSSTKKPDGSAGDALGNYYLDGSHLDGVHSDGLVDGIVTPAEGA